MVLRHISIVTLLCGCPSLLLKKHTTLSKPCESEVLPLSPLSPLLLSDLISTPLHCPVSSSSSSSDVISWIGQTIDYLQSSRPTAVNLGEAMDRIRAALKDSEAQNQAAGDVIERVKKICGDVHDEDLKRNMEMGRLGAEWLWKKRGGGKKGLKVVTVCNTGSLATSVSPSLSWKS